MKLKELLKPMQCHCPGHYEAELHNVTVQLNQKGPKSQLLVFVRIGKQPASRNLLCLDLIGPPANILRQAESFLLELKKEFRKNVVELKKLNA